MANQKYQVNSNGANQGKEDEHKYGCLCCKSKCPQVACNNPKAFVFWLSWYSIMQGFAVNGVTNVIISTLERRYNLPSTSSSFVASSYDIGAGIFVIPISFIGAYGHQPRILAIAAFMLSLGSFIMTIPHWVVAQYELGELQADECSIAGNVTDCMSGDSGGSYLYNYLYVFILAQLCHGFGGAAIFSLGIIFIDSHVETKSSPMYQAVMYFFAALGPALGYLIGGELLDIYVDVDKGISTDASPGDPRFVGAWWIGFLASGILILPVCFGLFGFPRELPQRKEVLENRVSQTHQDGRQDLSKDKDLGRSCSDIPVVLRALLFNPVVMFVTCGGIVEGMVSSGWSAFMAKFLQNQFNQSPSAAGLYGGGAVIIGTAGGTFFGGVILRVFKLNVKGMLRMCIGLSIISIIVSPSSFASCPSATVAGVNVDYVDKTAELSKVQLLHECNKACKCTANSYEPICGWNNVQYFSPCHAGCDLSPGGTQTYSNCTCLTDDTLHLSSPTNVTGTASEGMCPVECNLLWVFLGLFLIINTCTFMLTVPGINITIRCIPENQRSFALGVKWVFMRFLGMIPGAVIFGAVFDSACVVWQEDECGNRGSCWIYDNFTLALRVFIAVCAMKVASLIFFLLAAIFYKPPPENRNESLATNDMTVGNHTYDNRDMIMDE